MSNSDLQHLFESGADGDIEMNGNSVKNVLPPLTRSDTGAFLSQAGSSTWKNRTYESREIVDTGTTYDIGGATPDYNNLAEAANDLRGIIITETINLKLQENITESSQIDFRELGGSKLIIRLNSYQLTLAAVENPFYVTGNFWAEILDDPGGGKILINSNSIDEAIRVRQNAILKIGLWTNPVNFEVDIGAGNDIAAIVSFIDHGVGSIRNATKTLTSGSISQAGLLLQNASLAFARDSVFDSDYVIQSGLFRDSSGTLHG